MSRPAPRDGGEAAEKRGPAARYLSSHACAFGVAVVIALLVDLIATDGWWFFWPGLVWGIILLVHYLYVKSISIDDEWAAERSSEVKYRAYDLSHIEDIRVRRTGSGAPKQDGKKPRD